MWDVKLKAINEQRRKTSQQLLTVADNSMVGTRNKAGERVVKSKGGQVHGGGRSDFGWWAHNTIYS